jgi:hypothetical protein
VRQSREKAHDAIEFPYPLLKIGNGNQGNFTPTWETARSRPEEFEFHRNAKRGERTIRLSCGASLPKVSQARIVGYELMEVSNGDIEISFGILPS